MSVIGYIDATDEQEVQDSKYTQARLVQEKIEKGFYETSDFYLVRATDYISNDFIIKPICDVPFVTNCNDLAHEAMDKILSQKYGINVFNTPEEELEKFRNEVNQNSPLSTQYRSTVHFTLNSRVTSHSKGDFENSDFIILDSLSNHLDQEDLVSFRMEDTFFKGDVKLSNSSIVMISKEKYDEILKKTPWLENYNVVLYSGNDKMAVEMMLSKLGIVCEQLASNHAFESPTMPMIREYISKEIMEKRGIEPVPHYLSQIYKEDDEKNIQLWNIYRDNFYRYLLSFTQKNDEEKESTIENWLEYNVITGDNIMSDYMGVINEIGIDKYCQIVKAYNSQILNAISAGIYPTNREIIEAGKIELNMADTKQL